MEEEEEEKEEVEEEVEGKEEDMEDDAEEEEKEEDDDDEEGMQEHTGNLWSKMRHTHSIQIYVSCHISIWPHELEKRIFGGFENDGNTCPKHALFKCKRIECF